MADTRLTSVDETSALNSSPNRDDEKQARDSSAESQRRQRSATDNILTQTPTQQRRRRMSITQQALNLELPSAGAEEFTGPTSTQIVKISRQLDDKYIDEIRSQDNRKEFELGDVLEYLGNGMDVIVEDDFSLCFERAERRPWNWNFYLFIFWVIGFVIRYLIFFPIRLIIQILGMLLTLFFLWLWDQIYANNPKKRERMQIWSVQFAARSWVFAWCGVLEYDGVIPKRKKNQIYVANHSTMIDYIILLAMKPFCVIGQLHQSKPFIAWLQLDLLKSLNCIWFDRKEQKNRALAMQKIKDHVASDDKPRLLIFPEGTCVNNEYCIQFKRGTFALGAEVCPIAIKYDKTFVDAYWISRERPFHWHLFDIMTSWAMVAKITYLEPQRIRDNETSEQFASRVKGMIAKAAGLKNVEWNGYLKHYRPSDRIINEKKKVVAQKLERLYSQLQKELLANSTNSLSQRK